MLIKNVRASLLSTLVSYCPHSNSRQLQSGGSTHEFDCNQFRIIHVQNCEQRVEQATEI